MEGDCSFFLLLIKDNCIIVQRTISMLATAGNSGASVYPTPRTFLSLPLDINPHNPDGGDAPPDKLPWTCDLLIMVSALKPTDIFAIGIDDPSLDRHIFCTSMSVAIKQRFLSYDGVQVPLSSTDGFALRHQRPYAMMRRQQNSAVGAFLNSLARGVTAGTRVKAQMLVDDGSEVDSPDNDSALTLFLDLDISSLIMPAGLSAGIITGTEEIEHVSFRLEFSRTARPAHVASLALMMAAHGRLGKDSLIGRLIGADLLHLVCDMYRLRLFECRRGVWNE
jgi:hypothetical protein